MSKITIKYTELFILLMLTVYSDIKLLKIKNKIVFPFMLLGLCTSFLMFGIKGLTSAFYGMILPFLLLIVLFALRMLGAGDIKLFCAIGSILGGWSILYCMAYSFLAGGILAIVLMILRKNGRQRIKYLLSYLKSCFLTLSLLPYSDFENESDHAKFPFAVAIALGTLIQVVLSNPSNL